MSKRAFLLKQIELKQNDFRDDSKKHKNMHRFFRYTAFSFSALAAILSGLALYLPEIQTSFNIAILFIGGASGLVASIEGLRKADELWIHERSLLHTLTDFHREIEYFTTEETKEAVIDEYFMRFQHLMSNAAEKWSDDIAKTNKQTSQNENT